MVQGEKVAGFESRTFGRRKNTKVFAIELRFRANLYLDLCLWQQTLSSFVSYL